MTLSNFDWTDKQTVKWFIMLPTGHEGPYSLETLSQRFQQGKLSKKTQVWAEGLPGFMALEAVLTPKVEPEVTIAVPEIDELPPIPMEITPDLPPSTPMGETASVRSFSFPKKSILIGAGLIVVAFLGKQFLKTRESFSIHRHNKMSPELYQKINRDFQFEGWKKDIFFKEYISTDLSHVWLVTGSFQTCEVEAAFQSIPGKLLALEDEKVAMKSKGRLKNHVVEFSSFDYTSGNKIVPGLYEIDIKASHCEWDGISAKAGNGFSSPDEYYLGRMKVVLYPKGAEDFYRILDRLVKKKTEIAVKTENAEDLFWQDLQQKLQTLVAVTLQIEQHFIDFLEQDSKSFSKNLKPMVDTYTKKFGHVLTNFVISNENYFKEIAKSELKELAKKKNYEPMVRVAAKNIGLESMKIIESLQSVKTPEKTKLQKVEAETKAMFKRLKNDLNRKLIQVTEDRSL